MVEVDIVKELIIMYHKLSEHLNLYFPILQKTMESHREEFIKMGISVLAFLGFVLFLSVICCGTGLFVMAWLFKWCLGSGKSINEEINKIDEEKKKKVLVLEYIDSLRESIADDESTTIIFNRYEKFKILLSSYIHLESVSLTLAKGILRIILVIILPPLFAFPLLFVI